MGYMASMTTRCRPGLDRGTTTRPGSRLEARPLVHTTAKEMQSPTLHMLEERQHAIRDMLTDICKFQIDQAIRAKVLPADVDKSFTLTLPNLLPADIAGLAIAFRQVLTAMAAPGASTFLIEQEAEKLISLITHAIALGLAPQLPGDESDQAEASDADASTPRPRPAMQATP
jgi:hypothetical protein